MFYPRFTPDWLKKVFPDIVWNGTVTGKVVHLTFDDGPIPEVTPWVLDMLKKYNQKATFFCVGDNVRKHPEIFRRIKEEGHGVGNHTYHHLNGWQSDKINYLEDVKKASQCISSDLFRPPYGKIKVSQFCALKKDFRIVLWTYLSGDFEKKFDAATCYEEVKKCSKDSAILVFHDNIKTQAALAKILPSILDYYEASGIRSLPV